MARNCAKHRASARSRLLRRMLRPIVEEIDLARHQQLLAEISSRVPNSIRMIKGRERIDRYNCFMYGLDLVGLFGDDEPFSPLGRWYVGSHFVEYLICNRHLMKARKSSRGSIAVYSRKGVISHMGVVIRGGHIRSKWGVGHLYEHPPREVPETYGNDVRCYEPIDCERVTRLFLQYRT